jgi:hypothetical protein
MRRSLAGILALAAVALLAVSVASAGSMSSVRFVTPKAGAATGSTVTFKVALSHFKIDAADVGKANKADNGHLHFSMDKGKYDYTKYSGPNGALAAKLGIAGKYSPSVAPTITYKNLPKGKHTLVVFLVNNDHSNLGPKSSLAFTVK